jgi:hypothetical protein
MSGARMNDALTVLLRVLDELGIRYFAVGSVASSIHGLPRFTQAVDFVVQIEEAHIESLASLTSQAYYMDVNEARGAIARGRAFNLIHLSTAYKIDLFPLAKDAFHTSEMARAQVQDWSVPGANPIRLPVASAEDTILSKLVWYRQGGMVSDRQWNDILGVAGRATLDRTYLGDWAPRLGVMDLLEKLFAEADSLNN